MSAFPHSHIFLGPTYTSVISGPHIQVIHTSTGDVAYTTVGREGVLKAGPVRCAAVDGSGRYLAASGEDKQLKVWEIEGLVLLSERELPKRPTKVAFTADSQTILVADKFGDIFSYPFEYTPPTEKQKKDALSSHENPSGGQLVLGHASLLTAFLLSADERYIVSADRDEHIRVSWFPQGYNIEMYCLGHTKFVSAIHNPAFARAELVSGGGDAALKVWDWMAGKVRCEIVVWDAVEPFVRVRGVRRRRGEGGEEPHEGLRRGKGKKAKGKARAGVKAGVGASGEGVGAEASGSGGPEQGGAPESVPVSEEVEKVLVVHKIETVTTDTGNHIIFSAVGATGLFTCPYPNGTATPDIRPFDLGQPVVDFVISDDGLIWVSLDPNWSEDETKIPGSPTDLVRVLKLSGGELTATSPESPLLSSLNEKCRIPVTPTDLKKLDIYSDLTAMPKNTDAEQDQASEAPPAAAAADGDTVAGGKQVSKKELGRLKSKRAVLAKVQAGEASPGPGGAGVPAGEGEVREPEAKKSRSERGDEPEGVGGRDVAMNEDVVG